MSEGKLPKDDKQARKLRIKVPFFFIQNRILYKKGYLAPRLQCVNNIEAQYLISEMHEGIVGAHEVAR